MRLVRILIIGAMAVAGLAPVRALAAPEAADGFYVDVVDAGFSDFQLTDFAYVDETHVLATGKSGAVRWVPLDDPAAGRQIAQLDVHDVGDLGLVSIALSDDYASSGQIHLASNHLDGVGAYGRLASYVVDDPANPRSLGGREIILDRIRTDDSIHSVGEIVVRSDGSLFLAVGDGRPNSGGPSRETLRTYDPDAPQGKILRVHPNGSGVADNPWYRASAPNSWRSRVWAVGLRNPFRFDTLPGDEDTLVIGNVGRNGDDSLFVGGAGQNYGWPCREGRHPTPGYEDLPECQRLEQTEPYPFTPPVWAYDRSLPPGGGVSVTGGTFANSPTYPAAVRGRYVFGDYARLIVWSARFDGDGNLVRAPEAGPEGRGSGTFARDLGAPVSFVTSPSGLVSWADILRGEIVRLRWTDGNRPPLARGSAELDETTTVRFSSEGSFDLDTDRLTYHWDFGDGRASTSASPTHTYPAAERFQATLTVTDDAGLSDTAEVTVPLDDAPPVFDRLITPGRGPFAVGAPLRFEARASDPEDGDVTPGIEWLARLEHCPPGGACHFHGGAVGSGGAFEMAFPDHGDDTSVEVRVRLTDTAGRTRDRTFRALPQLVRATPASDPVGADVHFNGDPNPQTVVAGSTNLASAPRPTGPVRFDGWSDGAHQLDREVVAPTEDFVLTARYEAALARVAGGDRIETAIAVSRRTRDTAETVFLVRDDLPVDALAATPLAGRLNAPVLLTGTDSLDERVAAEIDRLDAQRVVVVGGHQAVGETVAAAAAALGLQVERIEGADRYATAVSIARRLGSEQAYLVRGDAQADGSPAWADALAAGPVATRAGRAVLLVAHDGVPENVRPALAGLDHATVVGGPIAVEQPVLEDVAAAGPAVDRLGGSDRFETARLLDDSVPIESAAALWLATGSNWPDALAAGAAAAAGQDRLLLVGEDAPATTGLDSKARLVAIGEVLVAGGPVAVPTDVLEQLRGEILSAVPALTSR